jgi:hypothetical protein
MTLGKIFSKCPKCGAFFLQYSLTSPELEITDLKDPELVAAILADRVVVGGPDCERCYQKDFKGYFKRQSGDVSA